MEVIEARLPRRISVTKKEKPLNPYAAIVVGHSHVAIRCTPPLAGRSLTAQHESIMVAAGHKEYNAQYHTGGNLEKAPCILPCASHGPRRQPEQGSCSPAASRDEQLLAEEPLLFRLLHVLCANGPDPCTCTSPHVP